MSDALPTREEIAKVLYKANPCTERWPSWDELDRSPALKIDWFTMADALLALLRPAWESADRWAFFSRSPQTALMLGSVLDPNDTTIDWLVECNRLADAAIRAQGGEKQ